MAVSTMIVISGYTFPALSTDLTLTRTHSTYELVYEKDLNLSTLPRPTYKDADDQEQTVDGSYRLSVNPTEVAADAKEKFVKVLFYPATGELPQMEEVLKINVHWYKRYPFIKDLVLPVPSTITSESLSITLTGDTDWGYKGTPCEITAEQILTANSGLADDLVTAAGEMEYDSEAVPGVWSVLGTSYDGVSGICSVQFNWVPEDNKSFATLTASVDMSVTDNRKSEVDLLTKLSNHCSFTNNWLGNSYWNLKNEVTNNDSWHGRGQYGEKACPADNEGFFGKCLYFQSQNSYAEGGELKVVTSQAYNTLFATDFSLAVWVKITKEKTQASDFVPIASLPIIDWDNNFKNLNLQTGVSGDLKTVKVGVYQDSDHSSYISGEEITDNIENKWFFFVITYRLETSTLIAYVNNKKVLELNNGFSNHDNNNGSIQLGGIYQSTSTDMSRWFSGYMDELAIWQDKILTKKEMAALYNNGNALAYEDYE